MASTQQKLIAFADAAGTTHNLDEARPLPPPREMEQAFLRSDSAYDGVFYTGVKTTGIFCLPSCTARKPLPDNVEFFATVKRALFAGYRPCLRCRPLDLDGEGPEWVKKLIGVVDRSPDERILNTDLRAMGIDPARARRYFMRTYGLTFQAYCRGRRLGKALELIRNGESVDTAVFESGYESHSGFRDSFVKAFGQPPGKAADLECIQLAWINTPLGPMLAGTTSKAICLLEFTDRRMLETELEFLKRKLKAPCLPGDNSLHRQLKAQLEDYFSGSRDRFDLPLVTFGSEFETRVWNELQRIPHGEVRSYEDIARGIGSPAAVRAVGRANGMNRIAIVIPCHRVINKSGELGGYGGGLWRKRLLLHLERNGQHPDR